MTVRLITLAAWTLLALSGCAKEDANSSGNGPGDADGFGGRTDPQNAPAARDAAPGPLSETNSSTPTTTSDSAQDESSANTTKERPPQ